MDIPEGRKLPSSLENPVDNALLDVCSVLHPYFYKAGFTANGITILSGIFQIIGIVCLWFGYYGIAGIMYLIGYTLDVMDGYYARLYKMVSTYGDLLDHGKDTIVTFSMYMVVIWHPRIPLAWKLAFVVISLTLSLFAAIYLGCQESYYSRKRQRKESSFLAPFQGLCTTNDVQKLTWLRWGGTGTVAIFFVIYFLILHLHI